MPRGVYDRKKVKSTKGGRKLVAAAKSGVSRTRRVRRPSSDTIPTIDKSTLVSSIYPRSSSSFKERTVEVERGTTLIIKVI